MAARAQAPSQYQQGVLSAAEASLRIDVQDGERKIDSLILLASFKAARLAFTLPGLRSWRADPKASVYSVKGSRRRNTS